MKPVDKSQFLVICVLLLTALLATSSSANGGLAEVQPTIPEPLVQFSAFINIWLETNVDNLQPAVAYNSRHDEYLVVWMNNRGPGVTKDIYARRVRGDGTALSNFTIAHNPGFHNYDPVVAYNPQQDEYLIVWTYDSISTDSDIWARRVKWNGADLGLPAYKEFQLGRPDKGGKQINPSVAYNPINNEYLVVYENFWGGASDIDAQRISASDGMIIMWRNIVAGAGKFHRSPDVAHSIASNMYLIAYTLQPNNTLNPGDIVGKMASWNVNDISNVIEICVDTNDQKSVAITASIGEFLAVWEDSFSGTTTAVFARRLAHDGATLGPDGGFLITGQTGSQNGAPDVAYGGGKYLIVWHRFMGGLDFNVYGRYAAPGRDNGTGPEFAIDGDVAAQMQPTVACNAIGDCLMVEEDNNSVGGDFEIRGRLIWQHHIYMPMVIKK